MADVVAMKSQRWAQKDVTFEEALKGQLALVPERDRLDHIAADHKEAIEGRMFSVGRTISRPSSLGLGKPRIR
jgi:hypothetical protein